MMLHRRRHVQPLLQQGMHLFSGLRAPFNAWAPVTGQQLPVFGQGAKGAVNQAVQIIGIQVVAQLAQHDQFE